MAWHGMAYVASKWEALSHSLCLYSICLMPALPTITAIVITVLMLQKIGFNENDITMLAQYSSAVHSFGPLRYAIPISL